MPIAPNQAQKLVVLLHMWNCTKDVPRYEMQTTIGLIPVDDLQHARDYSLSHGYVGIKVMPV